MIRSKTQTIDVLQDIRPKQNKVRVGPRVVRYPDIPRCTYDGNLPITKNPSATPTTWCDSECRCPNYVSIARMQVKCTHESCPSYKLVRLMLCSATGSILDNCGIDWCNTDVTQTCANDIRLYGTCTLKSGPVMLHRLAQCTT
ncbi:hypothetical protein E3N88_02467 [Mikania micrantha]|uniref:Uncharacterized protein n=1 Tax=Mikania micrantha TaxID=192012 RepID=A0A5N6Q5T8_9ASTR|nr:hypothetical protein E3N88_02467 [Mikania micrantha]